MLTMLEKTAADAGIDSERQIQIALQAMYKYGGEATIEQIYEEVQRSMPLDAVLSEQGRATLRSLINRTAVEQGYVEPYDPAHPGWRITLMGRARLDDVQKSLGTEVEETLSDEAEPSDQPSDTGIITRPFDPSNIRVDQRMMSIFQVMLKLKRGDIELQPDFQRNFVWNPTRQSRLIESILLRIPLPAFYLDATLDDKWLVVDGLQRLSTLDRFYNRGELALTNLEFLSDLEGMHFPDLPTSRRLLIEDTDLNLYVIRPETPPKVKFTIFSRVNTGGLVLTPQEIRHALFQGPSINFLAQLAQLPEFLSATTGSISPLRMDDRECVLRFLAFHLTGYEQYGRSNQRDKSGRIIQENLDGFLSETMEQLNEMSVERLSDLREAFRAAMVRAEAVFGIYAFRKLYQRDAKRTQISKPLFEVWSVMLERFDLDALMGSREAIMDGFIDLMKDVEFNKAISLGTGSVRSVHTRFREVEQLLARIIQ